MRTGLAKLEFKENQWLACHPAPASGGLQALWHTAIPQKGPRVSQAWKRLWVCTAKWGFLNLSATLVGFMHTRVAPCWRINFTTKGFPINVNVDGYFCVTKTKTKQTNKQLFRTTFSAEGLFTSQPFFMPQGVLRTSTGRQISEAFPTNTSQG